ncbi:cerebellar degeneration-related protein 2-like [Acanthaster planci]|uniref:Cerebellar degeneration-related protein 2-like n=1 Tax=Acanthaster planci TaxID=133434 RepID=A0A8B7YJZ7_ACAPL|nr:cerebellar degeneration-related protein 2-like [Acanthaster planci]
MWSSVYSSRMPRGGDDMADSGSFDDEELGTDLADGWYENDLHLAAELGKTLLERNKELDENLLAAQQENEEQAMQIVYLEKQLQILRDVTESKAHIYEQLDLSAQETEKTNQRLQHDLRTTQQRILKMNEIIDSLEAKTQDQQTQIQQLKAAERERLREGRRQKKILDALGANTGVYPLRRARSHDFGTASAEMLHDEELMNMHQTVKSLQEKLTLREGQINDAEAELTVLVKENRLLEEKVKELEIRGQMENIKKDYKSLSGADGAVCKYCDSLINADFEALATGDKAGKVGGVVGTPEELGAISEEEGLMSAERLNQLMGHPKTEGVSLLGEINAQYNTLMDKYSALLLRSRCGSLRDESIRPRALSLRKRAETGVQTLDKAGTPTKGAQASPVDSMFENGPPEYKKLFKEIFEILHRPQFSESMNSGGPS